MSIPFQIGDDFDCSLDSLVRFGLSYAFCKLNERNMEEALKILKNLVKIYRLMTMAYEQL